MLNFIEIGFFILLGVLLRRAPINPRRLSDILNHLVVYIALPALVLLKVPQLSFSHETLLVALVPWGMLSMSVLLVQLLARIFSWSRAVTGSLLMVVPLGNTGFLGVPMIKAYFGDMGLPYLIIYDQLGTLLILVSYGSYIMARYGEGSEQVGLADLLKRIFFFPPMIAFISALLLRVITYPQLVTTMLSWGALALTPLVMTVIGLQLKLHLPRTIYQPFAFGMSIKLLVAPLVVFLVFRACGMQGLAYDVSVLEAGMPPMITAGALAVSARMDADLAIAMSGLGILLSFCSLSFIYLVLL